MPGLTFGPYNALRLPQSQLRELLAEGTVVRTDFPVNSFRLPVGLEHGEGWILLKRSDVRKYFEKSVTDPETNEETGEIQPTPISDRLLPLRFHNTPFAEGLPTYAEIPSCTIIEAHELLGRTIRELGVDEDDETIGSDSAVACRIVDPRWWWLRTSTGPGIGGPAGEGVGRDPNWPAGTYNVWLRNGEGGARVYDAATTRPGNEPWTWALVLADLWVRLPFTTQPAVFADVPKWERVGGGVGGGPPDWTPENLRFENRSIWRAICELVDYAHAVIGWSFSEKKWVVRQIGSEDALRLTGNTTLIDDPEIAKKMEPYLRYDARPIVFSGAWSPERVDTFSRRPVDHDASQPWSPGVTVGDEFGFVSAREQVRETAARLQMPFVQDGLGDGRAENEDSKYLDIARRYYYRTQIGLYPLRRVYAAAAEINVDGIGATEAIYHLGETSMTTTVIRKELPLIAPPIRHETKVSGLYVGVLSEELTAQGNAATHGGTRVYDVGLMSEGQALPIGTTVAAVPNEDGNYVVIAYNCEQAGE